MTMTIIKERKPPSFLTPLRKATLEAVQPDELFHSGRTLTEHLIGTASILANWNQPDLLIQTGLFHSIYSTPTYHKQAVSYNRRPEIRTLLGRASEQLIFLFSILDFASLEQALKEQDNQGPGLLEFTIRGISASDLQRKLMLPREQVNQLLIVMIANYIDQAAETDGAPSALFSYTRNFLNQISDPDWADTKLQQALNSSLSLHEELAMLDRYHEALAMVLDKPAEARAMLRVCRQEAPMLGEISVLEALCSYHQGQSVEAANCALQAMQQFNLLGFAWDKRLSLDEWKTAAENLAHNKLEDAHKNLFAVCVSEREQRMPIALPPRYFEHLRKITTASTYSRYTNWYPGLRAKPIWDSIDFSIARALEAEFPAILTEATAMEEEQFHSEAEAIERSGRWEVLMLFEAGRKRNENCTKMPTLTRVLENSSEVRTSAGLIYLSRMKADTKVAPHRGGNNHRLRLHLGIVIPEGDCKLRVDDQVLGWKTGECLVFDDFFEHEVWNNTDQDRLVLVVDLWHPDLTSGECLCLDSFQRQVSRNAQGRVRYWETNRTQENKEAKERQVAP